MFVVTAAVFAAARSFGLCEVDDLLYINAVEGPVRAFSDVTQSIWMPLTYLTYMLDLALGWGYGGMHVQSILWHAASAVMLYLLLRKLFGNGTVAVLAALVWSLHPLRVESVVWIASRKDVVSAFFLISALYAWVRGGRNGLVAAFALVVVGAMAKPSVMVFAPFAFGIDWFVTGERKDRNVYVGAFALAGLIAVEASWAQGQGADATAIPSLIPLWFKLLNALASVTVYLGNFIWPDGLGIQFMIRYPDLPRFSIPGAAVLLAVSGWFASVFLRRFRVGRTEGAAFAGVAFFFVALVPFLGVAGFGYHAFADRFTILPALGISLALAALMARFPLHGATAAVCCAAVAALGWRCADQTAYWSDNVKLLEHTLEVDRDRNVGIHRALGILHWKDDHDMAKVREHLKKALEYSWCDKIRDQIGYSCHFLVEADYDLGLKDEAEETYYWMRKWNHRVVGNRLMPEFTMAETLYELNTGRPADEESAARTISELVLLAPDDYITLNLRYRQALHRGDEAGALKVLQDAMAVPDPKGISLVRRWMGRKIPAKIWYNTEE